jgi:UDP:flavonoid glycosyltransferase YjiC (YdhE family)
MKRILFATIGSLGDLHPCLALGIELRRRGYAVTVASTPLYRARVEALGFDFRPMRPAWDPSDPELIRKCEDMQSGPEVLFRELVLPHLKDTYHDLLAAVTEPGLEADALVAGELVYAAPPLAEKLGLPWASAILSPTSFFSAYDPSLLVNAPMIYRLRKAGPLINGAILRMGWMAARHWWQPVRELRREMGLPPGRNPILEGKFSPHLVLALFSPAIGQPQPDWPRSTIQPGFVFYDGEPASRELSAQLREFLAAGDAPIVFTLGSTAVHNPGNFYQASVEAVRRLGRRAILLGARPELLPPAARAGEDILLVPYAPFSVLFPHASVLVHQGGSGTTGQALRAGKPMLFVPYGWDQPDNAARTGRLGVSLTVERASYSAETASRALDRLLHEPAFGLRAAEAAAQMRSEEDALMRACDAIEAIL